MLPLCSQDRIKSVQRLDDNIWEYQNTRAGLRMEVPKSERKLAESNSSFSGI